MFSANYFKEQFTQCMFEDQLQVIKYGVNAIYSCQKQSQVYESSIQQLISHKDIDPTDQPTTIIYNLIEKNKKSVQTFTTQLQTLKSQIETKELSLKKNEAQIYILQECIEFQKQLNQTLLVQLVQMTKERQRLNLVTDFSPLVGENVLKRQKQNVGKGKLKKQQCLLTESRSELNLKAKICRQKDQNKFETQLIAQTFLDINSMIDLDQEQFEYYLKQQIMILHEKYISLGLSIDISNLYSQYNYKAKQKSENLKYLTNDSPLKNEIQQKEDDKKFELLEALLQGKSQVLQTVSDSNESKASQIMQSLLKGFYKTTKGTLNLDDQLDTFQKYQNLDIDNQEAKKPFSVKQIQKKVLTETQSTEPDNSIFNLKVIMHQASQFLECREKMRKLESQADKTEKLQQNLELKIKQNSYLQKLVDEGMETKELLQADKADLKEKNISLLIKLENKKNKIKSLKNTLQQTTSNYLNLQKDFSDLQVNSSNNLDDLKKNLVYKYQNEQNLLTSQNKQYQETIQELQNHITVIEEKLSQYEQTFEKLTKQNASQAQQILKFQEDNKQISLSTLQQVQDQKAQFDTNKRALRDKIAVLEDMVGQKNKIIEQLQVKIEGSAKLRSVGNVKNLEEGGERSKNNSQSSVRSRKQLSRDQKSKTKITNLQQPAQKSQFQSQKDIKPIESQKMLQLQEKITVKTNQKTEITSNANIESQKQLKLKKQSNINENNISKQPSDNNKQLKSKITLPQNQEKKIEQQRKQTPQKQQKQQRKPQQKQDKINGKPIKNQIKNEISFDELNSFKDNCPEISNYSITDIMNDKLQLKQQQQQSIIENEEFQIKEVENYIPNQENYQFLEQQQQQQTQNQNKKATAQNQQILPDPTETNPNSSLSPTLSKNTKIHKKRSRKQKNVQTQTEDPFQAVETTVEQEEADRLNLDNSDNANKLEQLIQSLAVNKQQQQTPKNQKFQFQNFGLKHQKGNSVQFSCNKNNIGIPKQKSLRQYKKNLREIQFDKNGKLNYDDWQQIQSQQPNFSLDITNIAKQFNSNNQQSPSSYILQQKINKLNKSFEEKYIYNPLLISAYNEHNQQQQEIMTERLKSQSNSTTNIFKKLGKQFKHSEFVHELAQSQQSNSAINFGLNLKKLLPDSSKFSQQLVQIQSPQVENQEKQFDTFEFCKTWNSGLQKTKFQKFPYKLHKQNINQLPTINSSLNTQQTHN